MKIEEAREKLGTDYDISRELGRGGMAIVYDATHRRFGRRVALKILPPHLAFTPGTSERFVQEARLSAALRHPGIVRVYTAGTIADLAYFAMDLIHGESLSHRLDRQPLLDFADVHGILNDLADALGYAHVAGVVHRDVKPDNIIIDALTNRPVLTDLGIARAIDDDALMTLSGAALGTPSYMSPEQAEGLRDIDHRSDIYSLGVVGYELLTGQLPFDAPNIPALLAKHVTAAPATVLELRPDAPPALAAAVERALAKKPDDRWQSATEFQGALGPAPAAITLAPRPDTRPHLRRLSNGLVARTEGVGHRIRALRRRAIVWAVITAVCTVLNLIFDPDEWMFISLAWLCALDLAVRGAHLYGEDVTIRELFIDNVRSDPVDATQILPNGIARHNARYENARREAAYDYSEITRMIGSLSHTERELVHGVGDTATALNAHIDLLAGQLRELDEKFDPNAELTGNTLLQLDNAADALRGLRLKIIDLRDSDFERGLSDMREQTRLSGQLLQ